MRCRIPIAAALHLLLAAHAQAGPLKWASSIIRRADEAPGALDAGSTGVDDSGENTSLGPQYETLESTLTIDPTLFQSPADTPISSPVTPTSNVIIPVPIDPTSTPDNPATHTLETRTSPKTRTTRPPFLNTTVLTIPIPDPPTTLATTTDVTDITSTTDEPDTTTSPTSVPTIETTPVTKSPETSPVTKSPVTSPVTPTTKPVTKPPTTFPGGLNTTTVDVPPGTPRPNSTSETTSSPSLITTTIPVEDPTSPEPLPTSTSEPVEPTSESTPGPTPEPSPEPTPQPPPDTEPTSEPVPETSTPESAPEPEITTTTSTSLVTPTTTPDSTPSSPSTSSPSFTPTGTPNPNVPTRINSGIPTFTTTVPPSVFTSNLNQARELNDRFIDLSERDACSSGQVACINGANAMCGNSGAFDITTCSNEGEKCFAVPMSNVAGVLVRCLTPEAAEDILGQGYGSMWEKSGGVQTFTAIITVTEDPVVKTSTVTTPEPVPTTKTPEPKPEPTTESPEPVPSSDVDGNTLTKSIKDPDATPTASSATTPTSTPFVFRPGNPTSNVIVPVPTDFVPPLFEPLDTSVPAPAPAPVPTDAGGSFFETPDQNGAPEFRPGDEGSARTTTVVGNGTPTVSVVETVTVTTERVETETVTLIMTVHN